MNFPEYAKQTLSPISEMITAFLRKQNQEKISTHLWCYAFNSCLLPNILFWFLDQ